MVPVLIRFSCPIDSWGKFCIVFMVCSNYNNSGGGDRSSGGRGGVAREMMASPRFRLTVCSK